MKKNHILELILLAALWGASFLFMRTATPEFGAIPLVAIRTGIAALCLSPFILCFGRLPQLYEHWKVICVVGILNCAIPFCLFSYSMTHLSTGVGSILNASAAMWGALVAFVWLGDNLSKLAILGLLLGFFGVVVLSVAKVGLQLNSSLLPILAILFSTLLYGVSACCIKKYLRDVNALVVAAGSQLMAALLLFPPAILVWPETPPSVAAWRDAIVLASASTALGFILYFRLIANIGAAKTMTVVYLIPIFGVMWGVIFLNETVTLSMLGGASLILIGVSLTTGIVRFQKKSNEIPVSR